MCLSISMKREVVRSVSDIETLRRLYNAHRVICDFYEEYYGNYQNALTLSRDFCVLRDARNSLYYRIIELGGQIDVRE